MVNTLATQYAGQVAVISYHVNGDSYTIPWGQTRIDDFYSLGGATPTLMIDGWLTCPSSDFATCFAQAVGDTTDVTLDLSADQVSGKTWDVSVRTCVESGGSQRSLRIYTAPTLDTYPNPPDYSHNTLMQDAFTQDLTISPGACKTASSTVTFDDTSWADRDDIVIVAWAQDPASSGPATVYQAATMTWPFSSGAELAAIEITPTPESMDVFGTTTFTAVGKDQNGEPFELTNPSWYATGDGYGSFDPDHGTTTQFTAEYPGETTIVCKQGGVTGQVSLTITGDPPVLTSISVLPSTGTMEVGANKSYAAVGHDQYGSEVDLTAPVWSMTGDGAGTFNPSSGNQSTIFSATAPGTVQVVCTDGSVSGAATVTVTGDAPYLASLAITPASATVAVGQTKDFTATGTDQYDRPYALTGPEWTTSGDGDTAVNPTTGTTTTLTATGAGAIVLTASESGVSASANIDVTAVALPAPRRIKSRRQP